MNESQNLPDDMQAARRHILSEYHRQDNCMDELLSSLTIHELESETGVKLTVAEASELYMQLMHEAEGDVFIRRTTC